MFVFQIFVYGIFACVISLEDLKFHKIRNRKIIALFCSEILFSFSPLLGGANLLAGSVFFGIFTLLFIASNAFLASGGIGFGDVKLIAVLAVAFFDVSVRSFEIFLVSLWLALMAHICLHFLMFRKFPDRIAMAPGIFLASGLYLFAPIGLLLPQ